MENEVDKKNTTIEKSKIKKILNNLLVHQKISEETNNAVIKLLKNNTGNYIAIDDLKTILKFTSKDKIQERSSFQQELNNFLEHMEIMKLPGKHILSSLDEDISKELDTMWKYINTHPQEFSELFSLLKDLQENMPKSYTSQQYNLYIANKIVYMHRVEHYQNKYHEWVFCENIIDPKIETDEFQQKVDIFYKKMYHIKMEYFIDFFHFFAAYSAYNMWQKNEKLPLRLRWFNQIYKNITKVITDAERNNKRVDLPPELRRAFWYTLGWDILWDVAFTDMILDANQVIVDIYALLSLQKSLQEHDFDIYKYMHMILDAIKQKSDYKGNIFYQVIDEMLDIEIYKYRNLCMKIIRNVMRKVTPMLAVSYIYLCKVTNFFQ